MYKKIIFLSFALIAFTACKTEFSVNGEYEERAIVHFLLDQGKEHHFLKLNKTFLKEGDAYQFAKESDLHYFDNVVAVVEEIKNGSKIREWTLQDTIIHNKKEGVFYGPEQKLYFFKANDLDENAIYRLKIDIDNGNHLVSGQTELVKGVSIKSPLPNQLFNFYDNTGYKSTPITFNAGNAGTYKVQIKFSYEEFEGSSTSIQSVLWNLGEIHRVDMPSSTSSMFANGEVFYEYLAARIPVKPEVSKRVVEKMEIILTAGSNDLQTYILTTAPSSTLAQNKPVYSNVEGALGIFSSRVTAVQEKPSPGSLSERALSQHSLRELCTGAYTYQLGFCSDLTADLNEPFSCY